MKPGIDAGNDVYLHIIVPEAVGTHQVACLDSTEQLRAQAFLFDRDRHLYVTAHVFLRQVLSTYAELSPADWQFSAGEYGKPAISNPGLEALRFNLSHTHGLLACAVSWRHEVGVDIEQPRPLKDLRGLSRTVLSKAEMEHVFDGADSREQEQRFYTYWTLKEAYVKALGVGISGLSLPLQQISCVAVGGNEWCLQMDEGLVASGVDNTPVIVSARVCENGYPLGLAVCMA